MKQIALLLAIFAIGLQSVFAQTREITGTVTSAEDGQSIPGVSVSVKGTTLGTITDLDGRYVINVPQDASTLVFSFVGMQSQEVALTGNTANVVMEADVVGINEVVVTAMGISRQEKSLGYAVTKVKGEDLVRAKDANIINSLTGKVSGVRISQQSGSVGSSSQILIRGNTSLGGDNQPLFVVDGMPINNDYVDNGITAAVDYGNAAADINSLDVESINVLKGAAATALYGARAKNGAIIIQTKKGSEGKISVSYNSSMRIDKVAKLPEYQNEYAQGLDGEYLLKEFNGWGPKISDVSDQKFEDFLGDEVTLKAYPNNVEDFFDTGLTQIHNFELSGGDANSDFRISYTNTNQTGIIPQSEYKKNDFSFNVGRELDDWIEVRTSGNYSRSTRDGLTAQGSNDPNVIVGDILGMPRTTDIKKLRNNTYNEFGNQNSWDGDGRTNNPYFILDNNKITSDNERFYGTGVLTVTPTPWLTIKNQTGLDFNVEERKTVWAMGTIGEEKGAWNTHVRRNRVINSDLIATINTTITSDLKLSVLAGYNIYQKEFDRKSNLAQELTAPDLYTWSNAKINSPTNFYSMKRIHGVFGEISTEYKDMLFLSITGRNDWSSTLPKEHNSYFFPSVSLGYIFTSSFDAPAWWNFGKVRLNWANVGSDEEPYQLDFEYLSQSTYYSQYSLSGTFPHMGVSAFSIPRTLPNSLLKPQNQVSYEIGLDLRFLNNRISLDATAYKIDTKDQIIGIDVPLSTGYFAKKINAGLVRNKGIEITLNVVPVKTRRIEWNSSFNFSSNVNTVEELFGDLKSYDLTSGWSGLQIKAEPGEPMSLFGTAWKRNDAGEIIINSSTGLREITPGQNLGKIDPDFMLGFNNLVRIKDFILSATIDWRQGGVIYSGTAATLRSSGIAKETLENRGETFIDKGVNEIVSGETTTYTENTTPVKNMQEYWQHTSAVSNTEGNVYDASYMKLREISLTYTLPDKYLPSDYIKGLTIGIEGRNLWNIVDNVPHVDPELNFFGPGEISGGVEFNSVPMSRSFGVNIKLNF
ncbi:SusC/RagA family TonB-linked outer membrane protein [uncultured Sunxiuqinia sp.]|uniref:SusC/RagA family TonB-linked outer membrane protein n=1 Tax=uncultured Sunxiuqinia sp. TaxID=1573825 RepID=UPI0030D91F3F